MYQKFIGIDIGKLDFFVSVYGAREVKTYANSAEGFLLFNEDYQSVLSQGLAILETTGGYEMPLVRYLLDNQYAVHRANTRKVKHFIRSYGQLGKSDSIDAQGLAHYGRERHEHLALFVENKQETLVKLVGRRNDLKQMLVQEKNRLQAPEQAELRDSHELVITMLTEEMKRIQLKIEQIYAEDEELKAQKEVLKTIAGIGDLVAMQLLSLMPELGKLNRKQIASLGGLAPHPNESGKKIGYRYTRGGRKNVKPVLFMAAMSAARSHSELGASYKKLIETGKKKMVALTAIMRKILVIANAKIRDYYLGKTEHAITVT